MDIAQLKQKCSERLAPLRNQGLGMREIPARLEVGAMLDGVPFFMNLNCSMTDAELDAAIKNFERSLIKTNAVCPSSAA
jgi:hypothetical protein